MQVQSFFYPTVRPSELKVFDLELGNFQASLIILLLHELQSGLTTAGKETN